MSHALWIYYSIHPSPKCLFSSIVKIRCAVVCHQRTSLVIIIICIFPLCVLSLSCCFLMFSFFVFFGVCYELTVALRNSRFKSFIFSQFPVFKRNTENSALRKEFQSPSFAVPSGSIAPTGSGWEKSSTQTQTILKIPDLWNCFPPSLHTTPLSRVYAGIGWVAHRYFYTP